MSTGRAHHHHHHHRHHRRGLKHWLKKHRWVPPMLALFLAVAGGLGYWMLRTVRAQSSLTPEAGNAVDVGDGYRTITVDGKKYRYNSRIKTILYAGVDSGDKLEPYTQYTFAPRADSIQLIVMDEKKGKLSVIAISRDTMTSIRRYTLNGYDRGLATDHIGYAFTYGEGGKVSCKNLSEAVSNLLCGIPVNEYVVTNYASLHSIMKELGPLTVTVPNSELAGVDPAFTQGATATITEDNVETYVRSRDTAQDLTNVGRMQRQRSFIDAFVAKLQGELSGDAKGLWDKIDLIEDHLLTSVTRNKYLDLMNLLQRIDYSDGDYYTLPGENVVGDEHDEFYPDEEGIRQLVLSLFYEEL